MAKVIQLGKVYRDPVLDLYYVVVAYHERVPNVFKLTNVYEVVKLHSPSDRTFAAVDTVENSWELVEK